MYPRPLGRARKALSHVDISRLSFIIYLYEGAILNEFYSFDVTINISVRGYPIYCKFPSPLNRPVRDGDGMIRDKKQDAHV